MTSAIALRTATQRFVRDFGLLASDRTPCGTALPPATAHALQWLLETEADERPPRQQDLAAALGLDKSNVTRLCQRLERAQYIRRAVDETDRRARAIALTAKGRRVATKLEAASRRRFAAIVEALPASRREQVVEALHTLADALASAQEEEAA